MTQTQGRLFDEFAKLMNDAAGVAQGARREVETVFRAQGDRFISEMDIARREDIEIVRDLAAKALGEVERLSARVAELEAKLAAAAPTMAPDEPVDGA
ncbi:accessory factor UbiK family protein [Methylobrevis albus]|uniref:Accessory factor UbiK family protein n=1 Tax=Methylobrevis albus TaxID=2793297 RepID=A0A931MXL9_9HYPH|nr:accessory factor UbiK family protein [Methylobrevis albus]MBH0239303.1 accessory factor UbiK family protein [Methylobrevis albus]